MDNYRFNEEVLKPLQSWTHLGSRVNEAGARLIGHLPSIAPKAYLHIIYSALGEDNICLLENSLKQPLPSQYKVFLSHANGMNIFSGFIRVMGFVPQNRMHEVHPHHYPSNIIIPNTRTRPQTVKNNFLVLGFYKHDGSYACTNEQGEVFRCSLDHKSRTLCDWPDFDTWITSEIFRLRQLFDAKGNFEGK